MAVFEAWELEHLQQELQSSLEAEPTASGKLKLIAHASARRLGSAFDLLSTEVEFWSHIPRHAAIRKGFRRMFAQLADDIGQIIQLGIDRGEFRSVDTSMLARLLIATYDGLVLQWLADKDAIDWQSSVNTLTTVILQGLVK